MSTMVTTPNELEIRVERVFDAPRTHVYSVWTDPELIPEWWGDRTVVEEMDVRPGGSIFSVSAENLSAVNPACFLVGLILLLSCVRRPLRSGRAAAATS